MQYVDGIRGKTDDGNRYSNGGNDGEENVRKRNELKNCGRIQIKSKAE